jgi:probable HAF family extracellular repeat protein
MSLRSLLTTLSCAALCAAAAIACGATEYTITDLGPYPGGDRSGAYGINNGGTAVGSADNADNDWFASYWVSGVIQSIGGDRSTAFGINDAGRMCGETYFTSATHRAFRYSGGVMSDLGALGGDTSRAYAINSAGEVCGWAELGGPDYDVHAFLWLDAPAYGLPAGMNDLGTLAGYDRTEAYDLNDSGQTVGQASSGGTPPTSSPFLWLPSADYGLPAGLNDLGSLGGSSGKAEGINGSGQVCGWSTISDDGWNVHAFLWLPSADHGLPAGLNDLGALHGGDTAYAYARAVNESGIVVGSAGPDEATPPSAFVWDPGNGMRDLNALIDPAAGWGQLWEAWDVNDAGQIVGRGVSPSGETHGFLLTPIPEPSTFCLGAIALLAMLRRRARAH